MDIGVVTHSRGVMRDRDAYLAVAAKAEAGGYGFISVSDHVVIPNAPESKYPYNDHGVFPGQAEGACLEQLTAIGFLAGCTQRLRLLTSVTVVPHRQAVLQAKMLATADLLSGGRLIFGAGAGWMEEEFAVLGTEPYAERGRVTDEYLEAFKILWTEASPRFAGKYVSFDNILFAPKPVQKPHPPIWIGGESPAALRRTVKLADGWYPGSNNPRHRLDTLARLRDGIASLHRMAEKHGRDPASIDIAYYPQWAVEFDDQPGSDGGRKPFTGAADALLADIDAFAGIGVTHLALVFEKPDLALTLDRVQRFAEEVLPRVGRGGDVSPQAAG